MNLFEKAFLEIKKLVKDFKASEDYYLSPKYQEKEVRDDFINKFFIALGWDVIHDHQKNPYEQEVKVEKGVLVRGAQKRADYSFSLAPNFREPKFLVEAKKPARNLKNADDYFQTIRYGWHKQTPLGILTDFEEFHILDCRYGADINNALKKCYKEYRYTDYANEEKFAEIYWLFSREAVANNSIEKIAETLPKHKGKVAGKTLLTYEISQTIDDAFLLEIDLMREKLAKALKKNDEALTSEELTEATQKIIDRLVFIRFLEDKLIETEHYVSGFGDKGNAWEDFIKLCRRLDVKYNGVVFKKHFIDEQKFNGAEANEFLMICKGICHLNSRFLFNEIPIHIIGSIYERFLGKEVHATDKRVQIEEKPEVRKAGGVYYTPKYIVDYIVNNTIGKLIDNKTPEQISQMRFADIACGSGSFLIGACECLLQYHIKYYNEKFKNKTAIDGRSEDFGLCEYRDGQWNLTLKQKQNILLNNIYGVDIDAQAVEVTQLSLFLKLLEDETLGSTQNRQDVMFSKVLPDLSKNIICGNSLIGTDIKVSAEEERKINPMDFKYAFPEVFKSKTEKGYIFIPDIGIDEERDNDIAQVNDPMIPYKSKIKGGFDAVIGNPPYVLGRETFNNEVKNYISTKYQSYGGKYDLYVFFCERALSILKENGRFSFIIPNTILVNENAAKIRKLILENYSLETIRVFKNRVFDKAQVETVILVIETKKSKGDSLIRIENEELQSIPKERFLSNKNFKFNVAIDDISEELLNKILKPSIKLGEVTEICIGIQLGGSHGSDTKADFLCNNESDKTWKKVLDGKDINTYMLNWRNVFVHYGDWLHRKRNEKYFLNPKILIRQIGKTPVATYDEQNHYTLNTLYNIISISEYALKFFLAIINSSLGRWFWLKNNSDFKSIFPKIKKSEIEAIPICKIDFNNKSEKEKHDKMVQLVEQMLEAKKQLQTAKTDKDKNYYEQKCKALDTQIDNLVYELYGLTEDEIKIVEGK